MCGGRTGHGGGEAAVGEEVVVDDRQKDGLEGCALHVKMQGPSRQPNATEGSWKRQKCVCNFFDIEHIQNLSVRGEEVRKDDVR